MFCVGDHKSEWVEKGTISLEDWEEGKKPDAWLDTPGEILWRGEEPAWFKTGQRKVVTGADYAKCTVPKEAKFLFVNTKLVDANFRVRRSG